MRVLGWRPAAIAPLLAIAVAVGCSSYARHAPVIRDAMLRADYGTALGEVEKIDKSGSELLYCYEKGLILHEQGEWAASNEVLERAGQLIEELYTRSVTREIAAITVSETIVKYRGDPFESVFINYYKILNYLHLGDIEGALVECRRLNARLQLLHDAGETYFVDDPFLQYLTALVYELGGEWDSAEVSYRAAADRYGATADSSAAAGPPWLYCDAAANARVMGDPQLSRDYTARAACAPSPDGAGRVAVLVEYGSIAHKVETSFTVPIFEKDRWDNQDEFAHELALRRGVAYADPPKVKYWLRVALPALEIDPPSFAHAVVRATPAGGDAQAAEAQTVCVEDLDAQAARAFAEKETTIVLRAVARALAKYLASELADDKDEALGTLVNILGMVTETADTRSWTTLPRAIHLARFDLEPGRYRIEAVLFDADGVWRERKNLGEVVVRRGGLVVRNVRAR